MPKSGNRDSELCIQPYVVTRRYSKKIQDWVDREVSLAIEAERKWFIKVLRGCCQCQHGVCHCCTLAGVVEARICKSKETT